MNLMGLVDKHFIKKPRIRKILSMLIYGNKDNEICLFDTRLFINSIKENGYFRAAKYAQRSSVFKDEISPLINISNLISASSTFIDVGANVGLFSSTMARFQNIYPDLEIHAFEANPDTFDRLQKTVAGTRIKIYNNAISNQSKDLEFVQGAVSHVFAVKEKANSYHYKNAATIKVAAKRLDSFEFNGNDLVIKIDVEGHELEVLEGAGKLLASKRVKAIFLDGYTSHSIVINLLTSHGFELFNGRTLLPLKEHDFSLLAILKS
jgi:FkbM family methyltransferase